MNQHNIMKVIHDEWRHQKPRSFFIESPSGCGATWLAGALTAEDSITESELEASKFQFCNLSGESFNRNSLREPLDWIFARRIIVKWDLADVITADNPTYAEIFEYKESVDLLEEAVYLLTEKNILPVLIIDRFDKLASGLDPMLGMMRDLESNGSMATVIISPLCMDILKENWPGLLNSEYGDMHQSFLLCDSYSDLGQGIIGFEFENPDECNSVLAHIEETLGRRASSYLNGLHAYRTLQLREKFSSEQHGDEFRRALEDMCPRYFSRFLRDLKNSSSQKMITHIKEIHEKGENARHDIETVAYHPWKLLLLNDDHTGLSCTGLGLGAISFLNQRGEDLPPLDERVRRVAGSITFRQERYTADRVTRWINQFPEEFRESVVCILESMVNNYYFSNERINKYLSRLFDLALDELGTISEFKEMGQKALRKRMRLVRVQATHKSEGRILYEFCLSSRWARTQHSEPVSLIDALKEWQDSGQGQELICLCVDDFVGTGGTAVKCLEGAFLDVFGEDKDKWPSDVCVLYLAVAGFDSGKEHVEEVMGKNTRVVLGKQLTSRDRLFSSESQIDLDDSRKEALKEFVHGKGTHLYKHDPLGYGDTQCLVVFDYRVPNNTLPIFHRKGKVDDGNWEPLFDNPV